jgi:osmotically-inducible protein OsmY
MTVQDSACFFRRLLSGLALVMMLPLLQGCFGVVAVGAFASVKAIVDRRSLGAQTDDTAIEMKAGSHLGDAITNITHINVTSHNRHVLLTGEVPNETIRQQAAAAISRIENVTGVWNELVIAPNSSFAARSNDTFITSKVKARFVDDEIVPAHHVKVVTEAGTVFLLGIVNRQEAEAAIRVARTTVGVQKVVTLMNTKSDAEIDRIEASLANSADSGLGR